MLDLLTQSMKLMFSTEDDTANISVQIQFTAQRRKNKHDSFHFDKFTRTINALVSVWW